MASVAACAIVVSGWGKVTAIDRALPLVAALIGVASWLTCHPERSEGSPASLRATVSAGKPEILRRFAAQDDIALLSLPLLIGAAIGVSQEQVRLLSYGLVVTAALAVILAGMIDRATGSIHAWRAVGWILIVTTILKAIPPSTASLLPLLLLFVGLSVLIFVFGRSSISLHILPVVVGVALLTPLTPVRASLFPLVLALVIAFVRIGTLGWLLAAVAVAFVAGKWALLLVAIAAAPSFLPRLRKPAGVAAIAVLPVSRTWTLAAKTLAFSPASFVDAAVAPRPLAMSSALLVLVALLVRPAIALIYLITAVTLILPPSASVTRQRLALPSAVFAGLWVSLFAWSGALAPTFPLPLVRPAGEVDAQMLDWALAPGESVVIQPAQPAAQLTLVVSGSNVSGLDPAVKVGEIEFAGRSGRGFRRDVEMADLADWGAFRASHFFATRNLLPRRVTLMIREYGSEAFVVALSRIELELREPITDIRVTAEPTLPAHARFELRRIEKTRT